MPCISALTGKRASGNLVESADSPAAAKSISDRRTRCARLQEKPGGSHFVLFQIDFSSWISILTSFAGPPSAKALTDATAPRLPRSSVI